MHATKGQHQTEHDPLGANEGHLLWIKAEGYAIGKDQRPEQQPLISFILLLLLLLRKASLCGQRACLDDKSSRIDSGVPLQLRIKWTGVPGLQDTAGMFPAASWWLWGQNNKPLASPDCFASSCCNWCVIGPSVERA